MKIRLLSLCALVFFTYSSTNAFAQPFNDVAVGAVHICAISDTSDVECTTAPHALRYAAPEDLAKMIDIAAGEQHTCGIDLDGKAICWGGNQGEFGAFEQLKVPDITQPLVSIEAGASHTCAIDVTGRVWCWGLNSNQQTEPPGDGYGENGAGFIKVDGGVNFSCGIQTGGDIACWTNDSYLSTSSNIEGPFIDLDITYRTACGLKSDGSIDCWRSRFEPPNNGPYTDLVVSSFGVCGLNQNQKVDCTFDPSFTPDSPVFSEDTQFTAIESGAGTFSPTLPFCGLTVAGAIECSSSTQFDALNPPGADSDQGLNGVQFALTARRYSPNQIELFWNNAPARYGVEQILVEVYRNDVLVDTTQNSTSWYDPIEQEQNPVEYRIRAVDGLGQTGPFSSSVIVDNDTGQITYNDEPTEFDIVTPKYTVDSLRFTFSGNEPVVVWSGDVPSMDGLKGYEVRVNNEPVVFTDGFVHRLESFNSDNCNRISVAAMSDDGTILDYRTIVTNRFSRNSSCFDRF